MSKKQRSNSADTQRNFVKVREANAVAGKHVLMDMDFSTAKDSGPYIPKEAFLTAFEDPITIPEVAKLFGISRAGVARRVERAESAKELFRLGPSVGTVGRPPVLYCRRKVK